ncbi:anosmin-1-like [Pseudophryne corroboree]|uniref:anosmin-1-like n=1 Tax=Pseudophryne corroboree TaxID=495146 RepID=UPI00308156BB
MGKLDSKPKQCHRKCENHHECVTSCEFLRSLQVTRQGQCPSPHRASGFAAACVLSCSADRDCSGKRKCCANGCGFTCQMPVHMLKGVPLKPHSEFIFDEHTNRSVAITWKSRFNISVEPVLYILQRRWNYGIQPSEDQSTPWQTITVTAAHNFNMIDVRPGRWYQFRVAAVNVHGTQGFTTPSRHFHSTKAPLKLHQVGWESSVCGNFQISPDPLPPAAPNDVRIGDLTFAHNGTVSVHIIWAPPKEQDLKIHHYRISWSSSATGELQSVRKTNSWRMTDGVRNG